MAGTSEGAAVRAGAAAASAGAARPAWTDARPRRGTVRGGGAAAWLNAWPLTAWAYERVWRPRSVGLLSGGAFSTERELARLRAWASPLAGAAVLDVGTSAGLYARTLAREGAAVVALDASRAFLGEAARRARHERLAIEWVWGDAHALPFADGSFDRVVVGATLNELSEPARAVREIARVLRPDGRAWFMYARRAGRLGRPLQAALGLAGLRFPAPDELDAWAAAAGLRPGRREAYGGVVVASYGRRAGGSPG
mgnify:CR=1 FL=1